MRLNKKILKATNKWSLYVARVLQILSVLRIRSSFSLACSLLLLVFADISQAAFQYTEIGARPVGMNGAYTAVSDDINSIVYNVAGLGKITRPELSTIYAVLNPGITDSVTLGGIAYVQPLPKKFGTVGISDIEFMSMLYSERILTLSYGREIPFIKNVCFGINFKYLSKAYGQNGYTRRDPTFVDKYEGNGIGLDFGLLGTNVLLPNLSIAVVGKNVNQPDIRIKKRDIVPAEYRVGIGYTIKQKINEIVIDIDGLLKTNTNQDRRIIIGSEFWLHKRIAGLRAGIGIGNNDYYNVALGLSWKFSFVEHIDTIIDYGFNYNPTGSLGAGKHQISLLFRF